DLGRHHEKILVRIRYRRAGVREHTRRGRLGKSNGHTAGAPRRNIAFHGAGDGERPRARQEIQHRRQFHQCAMNFYKWTRFTTKSVSIIMKRGKRTPISATGFSKNWRPARQALTSTSAAARAIMHTNCKKED